MDVYLTPEGLDKLASHIADYKIDTKEEWIIKAKNIILENWENPHNKNARWIKVSTVNGLFERIDLKCYVDGCKYDKIIHKLVQDGTIRNNILDNFKN